MTCHPPWGPELPALASPRGSESGHLSLPAAWRSLPLCRCVQPVSRPWNLRGRGHCGCCGQRLLGAPASDDAPGTEERGSQAPAPAELRLSCFVACWVRPESITPGRTGGSGVPQLPIVSGTPMVVRAGRPLRQRWEDRCLPRVCCAPDAEAGLRSTFFTASPGRWDLPILQM